MSYPAMPSKLAEVQPDFSNKHRGGPRKLRLTKGHAVSSTYVLRKEDLAVHLGKDELRLLKQCTSDLFLTKPSNLFFGHKGEPTGYFEIDFVCNDPRFGYVATGFDFLLTCDRPAGIFRGMEYAHIERGDATAYYSISEGRLIRDKLVLSDSPGDWEEEVGDDFRTFTGENKLPPIMEPYRARTRASRKRWAELHAKFDPEQGL